MTQEASRQNVIADGGAVLFSRIVAQVCQFLIFLVSVRFLTQAEFGLFALATAVSMILYHISRAGWGQYILSGRVVGEHVGFVYGASIVVGGLMTLVGVMIGGGVAAVMNDPVLGQILACVSLTIWPMSYCVANEAVLLRKGAIRTVSGIWIVAELSGLVVGICALLAGWKEFGLVAARLAATFIMLVANLYLNQHRVTFSSTPSVRIELLSFYRNMVASSLLTHASGYLVLFVVGVMFGPAQAGLYRAAARFAGAFNELINEPGGVLAWKLIPPRTSDAPNSEALPAFVGKRLKSYASSFFVVVFPMFVGMACTSHEITLIVLGDDWAGAAPLISAIALASLFATVIVVSAPAFSALGFPGDITKLKILEIFVMAACLAMFGWIDPFWAAMVHIPASLVLAMAGLFLAAMRTNTRLETYFSSIFGPAAAALLMATVVLWVRSVANDLVLPTTATLIVMVLVGAATYCAAAFVICRDQMRTILSAIVDVSPNRLQRPVEKSADAG
ncbi:MAG: oligosaccharide flippase family protein [Pseudomonadota bacterium]